MAVPPTPGVSDAVSLEKVPRFLISSKFPGAAMLLLWEPHLMNH